MKRIALDISDDLASHLIGVKKILGHNKKRRVTWSELAREALSEQYLYGEVKCSLEHDTISAIKQVLPNWKDHA